LSLDALGRQTDIKSLVLQRVISNKIEFLFDIKTGKDEVSGACNLVNFKLLSGNIGAA
jgi:hypothetical protein